MSAACSGNDNAAASASTLARTLRCGTRFIHNPFDITSFTLRLKVIDRGPWQPRTPPQTASPAPRADSWPQLHLDVDACIGEIRAVEVGAVELRVLQIGTVELGLVQARTTEIRFGGRGTRELTV